MKKISESNLLVKKTSQNLSSLDLTNILTCLKKKLEKHSHFSKVPGTETYLPLAVT
jgi:hypothetical protein